MSAAPAYLLDLERRAEARAAKASRKSWPTSEYATDPARFCQDILGYTPWEHNDPSVGSQAAVLRALVPEDARVSWVSSHKVGKSRLLASAALWAWASFDPVRVFLFAPKIEHIEKIALWPEIEQLYKNSGRCAACRVKEHARCNHAAGQWRCSPQKQCAWCSPLGDASAWNEDPTCGLRSEDGRREILAYTSVNVDAMGGISSPRLFLIFDEAGGIRQQFFEAMHGNSAGGATWLMAGNPLHVSGQQYDAHHTEKARWKCFETSAEHTPNYRADAKLIPGLATRDWVKDRAEVWGKDSSIYSIRVLGKWPKYAPGQLIRVDEIEAAERRWYTTEFRGRLQIGVDVAFTGDEAVIAPRRGYKINELIVKRDTAQDGSELALAVRDIARDLRLPHERKPLVTYDAQGKAGKDFGAALRAFEDELDIVGIRTDAPPSDPGRFGDRRTELAHGFAAFLKRGGAIPTDVKLEGEISWMITRPKSKDDQRPVLPSNDEIKKEHGRSPDRFDSCKFACVFVEASDGLGDARKTAVEPTQEASAPSATGPAPANDDFIVINDSPSQSIFDRHAASSAALWGRA